MFTLACHSWGFPDLTLPESLGTMARAGFRAVDIGSGPGLNTLRAAEKPRALAEEIRADLRLYDLRVSDLYLMLPRISLGGTPADDERREREIGLFKALLPFAQALGVPGITVSPGIALPPTIAPLPAADASSTPAPQTAPADAPASPFDMSAAALREMLAAAQQAGIPLSFEPHLDSVAPTPAAALRLLDAVPGLSLTLDWAEMACQNVPHEAITALLPQARHLHIRQAARGKLGVPFDKGTLDLGRVVQALADARYTGALTIEILAVAGRHGSQRVAPLSEAARLRDALRERRDSLFPVQSRL